MIRFKFMRTILLAAMIIATAQTSAFAEDSERLEIFNDTPQIIRALYIVPSGQQDADWGNDIVGDGFMGQGDKRVIYYDPAYRYYHIKFILDNYEEYILPNVDLIDAWRINIWLDDIEYKVNKNARG